MAEPQGPGPDLQTWVGFAIGKLVEELYDPAKLQRVQEATAQGIAKGQTISAGAEVAAAPGFIDQVGKFAEDGSSFVERALGVGMAVLVGEILGIEVSPTRLFEKTAAPGKSILGEAIGGVAMEMFRGPVGALEPSDDAAKRFLGTLAHIIVHGWAEGIILERLSALGGFAHGAEALAHLGKEIVQGLGLSRIARTALRPLVRATISTPLEWKTNKTYTPTLLGPSTVVRQFARGRWDWADVVEELARQGYSEVRIDALLNEARKFFSVEDVQRLLVREKWDIAEATRYLRDAGYFDEDIQRELKLAGEKRIEAHENAQIAAVVGAYVSGDIDHADLLSTMAAVVKPYAERAFRIEEAELKRALNVQHLAPVETAQAVRLGILAMVDYRESLRRVGFTEDAILVKELMLRAELDKDKSIADHRAALEADRAAEKAARDAARAAKLAQVEAARLLARRGDESDLENAAVRGLIQLSRVEEVYRARYDADVVGILLDVLEGRRQEYLAEQQRRKDAELRVTARGLSIGELDASVLEHVMTLDRYRVQLEALHVAPADIDVLARTLESKLRARDAAQVARDRALDAAAHVGIDLDRFEQLVRRGVRTLAQYAELLRSLNRTDGAVADMVELLKLKIADDAAAQAAKAAAGARVTASGLTLDELRRAVVLGLHTRADYASALLELKIAADKQILLLAELDQAVADAERARTRREAADAERGGPRIPLATLARAARLGVLTPAEYSAQLEARGFTDADVLAEHDLLTLEISQALTLAADDRAQQIASVEGALTDGNS